MSGSYISAHDLWYFFKRRRHTLLRVGAFFCVLGMALTFVRYPRYQAKAQFQDSSHSNVEMTSTVVQKVATPLQGLQQKGKAAVWMKSASLLEEVVGETALQLELSPQIPLERLRHAYLSHFDKMRYRAIFNLSSHFSHFEVRGKAPKYLTVMPISSGLIEIRAGESVQRATLPGTIEVGGVRLHIAGDIDERLIGTSLRYRVAPLRSAAEALKGCINAAASDIDRSVVQLIVSGRTPQQAEQLLNHLMAAFQNKLKRDLEADGEIYMRYLAVRKRGLLSALNHLLDKQAGPYGVNARAMGALSKEEWAAQKGRLSEILSHKLTDVRNEIEKRRHAIASSEVIAFAENGKVAERYQRLSQLQREYANALESDAGKSVSELQQEIGALNEARRNSEQALVLAQNFLSNVIGVEGIIPLLGERDGTLERYFALSKRLSAERVGENEAVKVKGEMKRLRGVMGEKVVALKEQKQGELKSLKEQMASTKGALKFAAGREMAQLKSESDRLLSHVIEQFERETGNLKADQDQLKKEYGEMPSQWKSQTVMEAEVQMHQAALEEIAALEEAVASRVHMMKVEARPIESAYSTGRVMTFGMIPVGILMGGFAALLTAVVLFALEMKRGIPAALETLKAMGCNVLSPIRANTRLPDRLESDLLLREIAIAARGKKRIAFVQSAGPIYAPLLHNLFPEHQLIEEYRGVVRKNALAQGKEKVLYSCDLSLQDPEIHEVIDQHDLIVITLNHESADQALSFHQDKLYWVY